MNRLTGEQIQHLAEDLRALIAQMEPLSAMEQVPQIDTDILRDQLRRIYEKLYFAPQATEKLTAEKTSIPNFSKEILQNISKAEASSSPKREEIVIPENNTGKSSTIIKDEPIEQEKPAKLTSEKTSIEPVTQPPVAEIVETQPEPVVVPEPVQEKVVATPAHEPFTEQAKPAPIEVIAPAPEPHREEKLTGEKTSIPVSGHIAAKHQPKAEPIAPKPAPVPTQRVMASDIIAQNMQGNVLANRFQQKPITNIASAIGLNDKFQYIRTLFDGKAAEFTNAITKINAMQSFDEAMEFIGATYQWDMEDAVTIQFLELVNRRFL